MITADSAATPKRLQNRSSFVLPALVAISSMWGYAEYIVIPQLQREAARTGRPRGNLSDLYPRWLGARELLLHGRDPYAADLTREIQIGYYGRVLDPSLPNDPKDQEGFVYPVYVVFLLAPTVHLPFRVVQTGFRDLLVLLTALSIPLWLLFTSYRLSPAAQLSWILLTLGSLPALQGIKLQQLSLLVCSMIAASAAAVHKRKFVLAGILLALATIKPQLVALPSGWLFLWILGDWRGRQRLAWSFLLAMTALIAGGLVVLPGWISRFWRATMDYERYTGGWRSILDYALSSPGGKIASVLIIIAVLAIGWILRGSSPESTPFVWGFSLTLTATVLVLPMIWPYNQFLLLPGLMLAGRSLSSLWQKGALWRLLLVGTAVTVLWPCLAAAAMLLSLIFLPLRTVQAAWTVPLMTALLPPLFVAGLLAAYPVAPLLSTRIVPAFENSESDQSTIHG